MGVSNPTLLLNICPIKSRCISCLFWVFYAGNWGSCRCSFMCIRSIIVIIICIISVICTYIIVRTSLLLCSLASPARLRAILSRRNSVIYTVEKQPVRLLLSGWVRVNYFPNLKKDTLYPVLASPLKVICASTLCPPT